MGDVEYKVVFDRAGCIGAAVCCAVSPRFWQWVEKDAKVDLVGASSHENNSVQTLTISEEDLQEHVDAAASCPVNVITITHLRTGEKII